MTDPWMDRLSEYLDGELNPDEQARLDQHLAGCESCRDVLAQLRGVVVRAEGLPDREPELDLWPAVGSAIADRKQVSLEARRRRAKRFNFSLPQLVAAAATLVLVSGGGVWLALAKPSHATLATRAPDSLPVKQVVFDRRNRADSAITELQRVLDEGRGKLDTSTVRILAENLALIDRAIDQARKALEKDPGNVYLNEHLARTMRKKIEVLRRAADLASVAS